MAAVLTNYGEEYLVKNSVEGSFDVLLYSDATDNAGETTDLADITTEPTDGDYTRLSVPLSASSISGDWASSNGADVEYDTTDTTGTVDAYAIVANFVSTEAGDTTATDHIISTGLLSQSRDLFYIDVLNVTANTIGFSVD